MAEPNIHIRLKIDSDGKLPAGAISQAIQIVEEEAFQAEYQELGLIFTEMFRDGGVMANAPVDRQKLSESCYSRLEQNRGRAIEFDRVEQGSLILWGLMVGLSYWIIENTVGESFKDAYQESGLHERLKSFFKMRLDHRARNLDFRVGRRLEASVPGRLVNGNSQLEQRGDEVIVVVKVVVIRREDQ
jgi:hypothetical protein